MLLKKGRLGSLFLTIEIMERSIFHPLGKVQNKGWILKMMMLPMRLH
jgi:hypothetical protein